jgi:hypothetical protein
MMTNHANADVPEALVGLLPSYWAHIPMLVAQIHDLHVINGFHCLPGSCIPISRCCLMGCIVAYERKISGSSFVLDDGTGLMDCIYWEDDQFRDALPALADDSFLEETSLGVGMIVKVMGRLEGTAMSHAIQREIRVSWCQPIHAGSHRRAAPFSLDAESRHVLKVAQHTHPSVQEVLDALGTNLCQQIVEKQDFPSSDDTISAWRLFGVYCKCPSSNIKTELLYCSCIATPESTDANFCFRIKLLELLLSLRNHDTLFYFQYRQLLEHQHHFDGVASHTTFNYLLQRTIGALRTDGIIALVDENSDTHLLITYQTVLKPYVELLSSQSWEDSVIRSALQKNSPEFLRNVPKGKMQLVRRMLQEETNKQTPGIA